jgi:hypothetical protein
MAYKIKVQEHRLMKTCLRARAVSTLAIVALLLTGCGAGSPFRLVIPRIYVEVDAQGALNIAGFINPGMLSFFGADPNLLKIDAATVGQLTNANVQHIELLFRNDGLYWWLNGQPLVPLTWDSAAFDNARDLLFGFAGLDETTRGLLANIALPLLLSLEQNVVIRFPLKAGEAPIPERSMDGALPQPGASVDASLIAGLRLSFDDAGVPAVAGVSFAEIARLANVDLSAANLPPDTVQQFKRIGIQHITLRTTPEGVKLWSNGQPLPTLRWSEETLNNTADALTRLRLIDPALNGALKQFMPYLNRADVDVVLRFPTGGAAPIPEPAR